VWSIYLSMAEKRKLGEMLLEAGLINELQLRGALNDQGQWGRPLGVTLISMGFVSEAELMRVLSDQLCYPFADLDAKIVAPEVIELVPYEIAAKHHCLPLTVQRKGSVRELYLAMFDPTDLAVIDDIRFRTGHEVRPVLVGNQKLEEAIQRSYRTGDAHGILKPVTLDDIEDPGAAKRRVRPATTEPEPVTGPTLELESESSVSQPLVPVDEPELVLTEKMSAPTEAFFTSSPESQRYVLQALVQLLISEDLIDPDRLFKTIKSIAGERD
jgi:type IV pilus assembly protein PilB